MADGDPGLEIQKRVEGVSPLSFIKQMTVALFERRNQNNAFYALFRYIKYVDIKPASK